MSERGMLVVARFLDGRMIKGRTTDLRPKRKFHVFGEGASRPTIVDVTTLKLDLQYWPTYELLRTAGGWRRQPALP